MEMIPPRPATGSTHSESDVFWLLRQVEFDGRSAAFSAVHLSDHEYKKWSELDFVVVSRAGLIVIEVKGGLVSCDGRGIWRYDSRGHATVERAESPMAQASSAYFALLKSHLIPAMGRSAVQRVPTGFCVILARTPLSNANAFLGGTDMPIELVGTSEDVRSPDTIAAFLERVITYWRKRPPWPDGEWTDEEVIAACRALRPCFDRVAPLSLSAVRVRQEQFALTEEQYALVDFFEDAPRLMCSAGAGCGKTLLAVECLRRELRNDPLLLTGTNSLAANIRASWASLASRVVSFRELEEGALKSQRQYGCLIVDEGQQVTNPRSIGMLSTLLKGGIEDGRWRWFSDPNNQVLESDAYDPASQALLVRLSFPGRLRRNCRNTPQIIAAVEVLTGAEIGNMPVSGGGPDIIVLQTPTLETRMDAAVQTLRTWLADPAINPGEIVLLTPRALSQSSAWEIARRARTPAVQWHPAWDRQPHYPRQMAVATLQEFRGLESPFVLLCDLDRDIEYVDRWIYLGITRANFAVAIVTDPAVIDGLVRNSLDRLKASQGQE
jgi:hypothetical protein